MGKGDSRPMAQKHGSQSAWEWCAAWLCWSPSLLRGVSLEAGQPQLPAWGSWRWRPGELTNSGGRSTAWGWKALCRSGSSQALVSSPSTAGGYLAKNFMQLLDTQKEEIKRYDFWLKWKRISDWIWWRSKKKHCEKASGLQIQEPLPPCLCTSCVWWGQRGKETLF